MAKPIKLKKSTLQFMIAALIAVVCGAAAIALSLMLINTIASNAQQEKAHLAKQVADAQAEAERAKKLAAQQPSVVQTAGLQQVVAKQAIPAGTTLTADMLETQPLLEKPSDDSILTPGKAIGQVTAEALQAGQTLTFSQLVASSALPNLTPGMRAITIAVDAIGGLKGLLVPGVTVDVLSTLNADQTPITKTLLQNVRVLSVDGMTRGGGVGNSQAATNTGNNQESITLLVTPAQAELLALANTQGRFHLTLRGLQDKQVQAVFGVDPQGLLNANRNRPIQALPSPPKSLFTAVPFSPASSGDLPELPNMPPSAAKAGFKMEILQAGSTETKTFEN